MKKPKYKPGDDVKIINPDRWSYGCLGVVSGSFSPPKATQPYYLVKLTHSPNPYISATYVLEEDIEQMIRGRRLTDNESWLMWMGEL